MATSKRSSSNKDKALYPNHSVLSTGMAGKCPRCGQGKLFQSFLKPVAQCANCQLDMSFAEEGDGPAVFVIFILGFVIVGLALFVQYTFLPPFWVHIILWVPITVILGSLALKIIKGIMIAAQYKTGAAEGKRDKG